MRAERRVFGGNAACAWTALACAGAVASVGRGGPPDPGALAAGGAAIDFGRDVRPILAGNCFKCHGPDEGARQAGLRLDTREGATGPLRKGGAAVVPGDGRTSELLSRVTSDDPDERMPPPEVSRHGLNADQVGVLRRWIDAGAPWGEHWAFVPPVRREAPTVADPSWCRGGIDRWVMARLDREGLEPSPEAARTTLLRRASLDLIGLPAGPGEVDEFLADPSPDAYERAVDRLLASPRFGEKWARWWLDLARYADTKGYEKDGRRSMWPYRDWVIRAFNADLPFDRFTLEQLAGDMVPEATEDQLVATAFHRNTMTNDEGGTDNEEFRVAAVVDRVNTTSEVWLGLTMGCAQCHTHKFDPIPHTDYYRLFAIFNNTEDADREDEAPTRRVVPPELEAPIAEVERAFAAFEPRTREAVAHGVATPDAPAPGQPVPPAGEPVDVVWIDDALPAAGVPRVEGLMAPMWPWRRGGTIGGIEPAGGVLFFGAKSRGGPSQQFVSDASPALPVGAGDLLFAHVYIDPADPPKQIVMQWHTPEAKWEQRAYWGERVESYYGGKDGTDALRRMGDLPPAGEAGGWVRLEVPAAGVGLEGRAITGWAFTQTGGTVYWDKAGVRTAAPPDLSHSVSMERWLAIARENAGAGLPDGVKAIVLADPGTWTDDQRAAVRSEFVQRAHGPTRAALAAIDADRLPLLLRQQELAAQAVDLPVMRERGERRTTHRFVRGSFLSPAEEVLPGTPGCLTVPGGGAAPTNRLEFARWLFAEGHPLTGRVLANRVWEQVFGAGIVETVEDFGVQGSGPSHPELLDQMAVDFRDGGWSLKSLLREIVTSATYRQSSAASPELLARDPANRLLARGPRFRLDGETIRDQALAASGLLSANMFGPPVFPPQPEGLWLMVYSGDRWVTSTGEDRYRRGLYTFARRTVPYPAMTTFDAPSREVCVSRRIRTNTPLQAFVTLNDPAFVECAQAMARRVLGRPGPDAARIAFAFKLALGREPTTGERGEIAGLLADERARCRADPDAAVRAATVPLGPLAHGADAAEAAAWTAVASVLLNLDEALTKE